MKKGRSGLSRRRFFTTSLGCLATAGMATVAPQVAWAGKKQKGGTRGSKETIYRELGKTGMKVPIVSMGVMNANNPDVVRASYDLGVRHFDTAARYQFGRNEQMVGEVIQTLKARDKVVIATKELRPAGRGVSSEKEVTQKMIDLCEGSLRRLKTDYVDILYVHAVDSAEGVKDPGLLEAMRILKKQGKVRASGVSTHEAMAEVINEVARSRSYDVVLTSINVAMADNVELLEAIKGAASKGVGIIAMKTQAGGRQLPNPETLREHTSTTIATASLKWVLRNENIATAIPGYATFEHMEEDFSVAAGLDYTQEEEKFLSDNRIKLALGFCHQCRQCVAGCPKGVEIPGLMRTYMYAAQYSNFHEARVALDDIPAHRGLSRCRSCEGCSARCANHVDIQRRMDELKLMYA